MLRVVDIHLDISQRRTATIVSAIHLTEDCGTNSSRLVQVILSCITDVNLGITHVCEVGAAVHIASDGTTQHVDMSIAVHASS